MASLNLAQMTEAAAVLARCLPAPFANGNQTGIYRNNANQLVIPMTTYNGSLGTNLVSSQDGTNIYITLNVGDAANGV